MKRVLTIQDISCLGKCSITVALPLISAMGVETVILPSAVFDGPIRIDLQALERTRCEVRCDLYRLSRQ